MAISTFQITHNTILRDVVAEQFTVKRNDSGDAEVYVFGTSHPVVAGERMQKTGGKLDEAEFDKTEIVTAAKHLADTLGITITPAQLGQIILGLPEQLIRNRFEDA